MINMNVSKARSNFYKIVSSCIKHNDVISISTKDGNVVLLSEDNYNSLIESLYLAGIKNVYEDIKETVKTTATEFIKNSPF